MSYENHFLRGYLITDITCDYILTRFRLTLSNGSYANNISSKYKHLFDCIFSLTLSLRFNIVHELLIRQQYSYWTFFFFLRSLAKHGSVISSDLSKGRANSYSQTLCGELQPTAMLLYDRMCTFTLESWVVMSENRLAKNYTYLLISVAVPGLQE